LLPKELSNSFFSLQKFLFDATKGPKNTKQLGLFGLLLPFMINFMKNILLMDPVCKRKKINNPK